MSYLAKEFQIEVGDRVIGCYGITGISFQGKVRAIRSSHVFRTVEFLIDLDAPIDCFGEMRSAICVHANPAQKDYRNDSKGYEKEWIRKV